MSGSIHKLYNKLTHFPGVEDATHAEDSTKIVKAMGHTGNLKHRKGLVSSQRNLLEVSIPETSPETGVSPADRSLPAAKLQAVTSQAPVQSRNLPVLKPGTVLDSKPEPSTLALSPMTEMAEKIAEGPLADRQLKTSNDSPLSNKTSHSASNDLISPVEEICVFVYLAVLVGFVLLLIMSVICCRACGRNLTLQEEPDPQSPTLQQSTGWKFLPELPHDLL